jgi:hypothetical protein
VLVASVPEVTLGGVRGWAGPITTRLLFVKFKIFGEIKNIQIGKMHIRKTAQI